ncbi:unnamed protein product [Umbelopsis sp. WA50703]
MAATDDRKRRYPIEPSDSDQIPRQPPKKRFLSSTPTSPTNSHAADMADEQQAAEDPNDPFKNQILNYQKDAIFRQTTDYKRMARRLKRKASVMEADIAEAEGRYQAQAQPWSKVNQELQDLSSTVLESSSVLDQTQVFEKLFSHSYLWSNAGDDGASPEHSDMLRKEAGPIHGIIRRMGHHLDKQIASRTNLFEKYKDMLDHNASGKYASSLSRWKDHQQLAVDKQRAYRVIVSELISVKGQYEAAVHKSRKLQKYIMEMKNETVQASLNSASDVKVGQSADMVVDKPDELNGQHDTSQSGTSQPEAIQPDVGTDIPISDDISQGPAEADPLTSVRLRAASILQEIDATKESNSSLKQQVDELQFALVCIGDNIVSEVPISKQLEHSVRQRQSRCRDLSEKCENLEKTLANCLQERCKLLDTNQNDSSEEMKAITEQMKSLEQVLSSTRSERDNLQTTLDEKRAKMEIERASVSEMKVLADARQARLNSVKKDKMRLILKCAASSGDRDMFELLRATQDIEGSMSSWLDSKLQSLEEEFEQLQKVLANAHQNSIVAPERRRLAMSQHYWQKKHERFQAELDTISRDYGDGNTPLNMRDPESVIQSLQKASEGKEKRIKELEQKLKDLETLESELLVEVAGLAAGFSELEEQNSQKVDELIKKEDEIVSLQSQKLKHNQTFTALNKSKDVFKLLSNQLQRQNDMQLEVIRQYNEHEKNINAQINNYDREMISVSSAFDLHQQQIADVQANHGDIEERLTGLTSRLSDLRQLIKDRSKLLEDIYYQRCRIEEESELLKRRLDAMARVENPTEMKLAKEREEYKVIVIAADQS